MPTYIFRCKKCDVLEDRECDVEDVGNVKCKCGLNMEMIVQKKFYFRVRDGSAAVIQWKKERGVLDL